MGDILIELSCGLTIAIGRNYLWRDNLIEELGDVALVGKVMDVKMGATHVPLMVAPLSALFKEEIRYSQNDAYLANQLLFDKRYKTILRSSPDGCIILESSIPCYEWFIWTLQMALLREGFSFVHGACVEKDGKAVLISSRGGVGKTAITEYFVRRLGWKLLGDDLIIVDSRGRSYAFPKPMVLYPYHKPIFPDVFAKGRKPIAPLWMNSMLSFIIPKVKPILRNLSHSLLEFARRYNPQSVKIKPSEVFGPDSIAKKAELAQVIWLDRNKKCSEPTIIEPDNGVLQSQMFAGTLLEFDPHCLRLSLIAMRQGIIQAGNVFGKWLDLLAQMLSIVPQKAKLSLPIDLPIERIGQIVAEYTLKGDS